MRPLAELTPRIAERLRGVVFDLDDTVLDHGALTEAAYRALFRLKEARLRLVACTGRPAGWGELVQRQWPVDATLAENGAIGFVSEAQEVGAPRVRRLDPRPPDERTSHRRRLSDLADELVAEFPSVALADDNPMRISDVTLDIGEFRQVPVRVVDEMAARAEARGVRTFRSSVHMHLTYDAADKASGALRLLHRQFGDDPTEARGRYAFVGDSQNDAGAFAAFDQSIGVANVIGCAGRITMMPRYVAKLSMGAGFAEIAETLCALR